MLLTVSLCNKGSFLGSLINKCRQVVRNKPVNKLVTNVTPNISTSIKMPMPAPSTNSSMTPTTGTTTDETNRPAATANFSLSAPSYASKSLEEKVGLPPKPKRPLTPFFRFMVEQRSKLQAANPERPLIDVVRQISKLWETADNSLKQRLQEEYKKDQLEYIETRTKYDAKITDEQRFQLKELKEEIQAAKEKRLMRKRIKDLGRPRKPASAFLKYLAKERTVTPQKANETFREWQQKAADKWNALTDEQKDVFIAETRKELEVYKKDLASWEERMIRLGHIDAVRHINLIDPPAPKPKKQ